VRNVRGVRFIRNLIEINEGPSPSDVKHKIEEALERSAEVDAQRITVGLLGAGEVVLRGAVRSWAEREEAERAAWLAPGVKSVVNELVVDGA